MPPRARFQVGAPGIYRLPVEPLRALTGERMDICAFVGVAPRGPARRPDFPASLAPAPCGENRRPARSLAVPVESWTEYVRLFGAFEGPGLLPYAVASFFENGGAKAYIVRIVHDYRQPDGTPDGARNDAGVARAPLTGQLTTNGEAVWLRARNEGAWGNTLSAELTVTADPLGVPASDFTPEDFVVPRGAGVDVGTMLRLDLGAAGHVLAEIVDVREQWHPARRVRERRARFEWPMPSAIRGAEILEGTLIISDGEERTERFTSLGLSSDHPRWLAKVLIEESELLYPEAAPGGTGAWYDRSTLLLEPALPSRETAAFAGGLDGYADIVPSDFFDDRWVPGDECPGDGVHTIVDTTEIGLLAVPDLYSPEPLAPRGLILDDSGSGRFEACLPKRRAQQTAPPEGLDGLFLDPGTDFAEIVALQRRLIEVAEAMSSFVVLLDVPPRLSRRRVLAWRAQCGSMYAAAYHPWLQVSRPEDLRDRLVRVNPSAVAAGIIARRERELGVQYGPANVIAEGVVNTAERISPAWHDELHPQAINVFLPERDGIRLTAARTLSPERWYRQLNVRRLVTMLCRTLSRQMQWVVFEPNNAELRAEISRQLESLLRQLFLANAFRGSRPEEAFFVRCDDELNPRYVADQGRLVAHVGVAPAEPLEFIVLEMARDGDSTLRWTA